MNRLWSTASNMKGKTSIRTQFAMITEVVYILYTAEAITP